MGIGKTLLKVAIGVVIAKGVASLTKGSSGSSGTVTAGRGSRIDTGSKGGLEDMMGDVLRSGRSSGRTSGGGLSDGGQSGGGQSGGGLGDLLDQLSGQKRQTPRATAPKGGLDDLLGELTGRGRTTGQTRTEVPTRRDVGGGGVGDLLDQVLADKPGGNGTLRSGPITLPEPEREEELSAALMLRAVIQAVKCDGELDD
ncbi:MAG: hypothetical protein IT543_01955, partial [Tabrizicola sp.]|nr:hypothetical protein [Tabrizicola sp.]